MEKLRNCSHETFTDFTISPKTGIFATSAYFWVSKNGILKLRPHFHANYPPKWWGRHLCRAFINFGWGLNQFWNLIILPCFYNVWFKFTFMFGPHFCIMYCTFFKWIKSCSCSLLSLVHICAVGHVLFMFISLPSLFRLGVLGMGGGGSRWYWALTLNSWCNKSLLTRGTASTMTSGHTLYMIMWHVCMFSRTTSLTKRGMTQTMINSESFSFSSVCPHGWKLDKLYIYIYMYIVKEIWWSLIVIATDIVQRIQLVTHR